MYSISWMQQTGNTCRMHNTPVHFSGVSKREKYTYPPSCWALLGHNNSINSLCTEKTSSHISQESQNLEVKKMKIEDCPNFIIDVKLLSLASAAQSMMFRTVCLSVRIHKPKTHIGIHPSRQYARTLTFFNMARLFAQVPSTALLGFTLLAGVPLLTWKNLVLNALSNSSNFRVFLVLLKFKMLTK